jgi:hypothetical protein
MLSSLNLTAMDERREEEYNKPALHIAKVAIFKIINVIRELHYPLPAHDTKVVVFFYL